MKKLPLSFYKRENIFQIAHELMGKIVVTEKEGLKTTGRIVELEAYNGVVDRASHAFKGRRTRRNETMYAGPGVAYMYICYGLHQMFNIVTNEKEIPHAILVRAIEPIEGIETMLQRRGLSKFTPKVTSGPGNVGRALGLNILDDGTSLLSDWIFIADDGFRYDPSLIGASARIGMTSAGEDAMLPYRFYIKGNPFVSSSPR